MPDNPSFIDNRPEFKEAINRAMKKALVDTADEIIEKAQTMAPIDTGNLARSIQKEMEWDEDEQGAMTFNIELGAYAPYALAVEFGTAGRGEPFTRRVWPGRGDWPVIPPGKRRYGPYPIHNAFGKNITVWHPGIYPQPYMRPAIDMTRMQDLEKILRRAFKQELGKAFTPLGPV